MGVNNSSENSNNNLFDEQNLSDYYGLKTSFTEDNPTIDNLSKFNFDTEKSDQIKEESNLISEKQDLIPTTFEWDNPGTNVYVTGTFCNWKQYFLMKKNPQGLFVLTLDLPRGNHHYKFKVDNEWKYNEKFPTCIDSGNTNNYLDTTNWEITVKNTDEGTTTVSNTTENNDFSKISKKIVENSSCLKMKKYSHYIPKKEEFSEKIQHIPSHYKNLENIDLLSNQKYIGNKKYLKINENDILSGNLAYKNIENIPHEQINHLNINNNTINDIKTNICSTTSRYRHKYTTFVYYNSKKK